MVQHVSMVAFCGTWLVNCDGSTGQLLIEQTGDPESPEYGLAARLTDEDGRVYQIDSIHVELHKISFVVQFTGRSQLFRGYLFTKARDAMAGYTVRSDDRFGWFAVRADTLLAS